MCVFIDCSPVTTCQRSLSNRAHQVFSIGKEYPMSQLTPEIFVDLVVTALEELAPHLSVERFGAHGLLVGGQRFELENLWRMVQANPSYAEAMIFRYCEEVFVNARTSLERFEPWIEVKPRIMPRIHPVTLFEQLERSLVVYRPWVNGTVVTFVCDSVGSTTSLRPEQMERWGVSIDELDAIALRNLERYATLPELSVIEDDAGGKIVAVMMRDGYDSARILLDGWQQQVATLLGSTFYAGIPARDLLFAFSIGPKSFVERLEHRIKQAFERAPYPISPHSFLVTPDGIAGTIPPSVAEDEW